MSINVSVNKQPIIVSSQYEIKQHGFENHARECLRLVNLSRLDEVKGRFLIFDLSKSYWYDLGVLLWFISLLNRLKKQGNDIQLIFPEPDDSKGINIWSFLIRWRFFETLSACVDDPANLLLLSQVPYMSGESKYGFTKRTDPYGQESILHGFGILEITTVRREQPNLEEESAVGTFLRKYADRIILLALSRLCGWELELVKTFIRRAIREGTYNGLLHSRGTFVNVSIRIDHRYLTLAIADNGVGIPTVLRDAFDAPDFREKLLNQSDSDLIKYFTEPKMLLDSRLIKLSVAGGVSSIGSRPGMGLYYLKSTVLKEGGELRIRSGRACVDFTSDNKVETWDDMLDSPGTMLRIRTPLKQR